MDALVRPIEVHVVLADGISVAGQLGRALRLLADILCLEEVKHAEPVDWIFVSGAFVEVRSDREADLG